jgi:hypothetical protein
MPKEKKYKDKGLDYVGIDRKVVQMVRDHKKKTYIPIGEFFRLAALEKLGKK